MVPEVYTPIPAVSSGNVPAAYYIGMQRECSHSIPLPSSGNILPGHPQNIPPSIVTGIQGERIKLVSS